MTTAFELGCLSAVKKAETTLETWGPYPVSAKPHKAFNFNAKGKISPGAPSFKAYIDFLEKGTKHPPSDNPHRGGIIDRGSRHIPTIEEPQLQFLSPTDSQYIMINNQMPNPKQQLFDADDNPIYKPHFSVTPNNLKELDRSSDQLQLQRENERGDEEFAQKQQAQKQQKQPSSKSLLSHLKNPYVLGGLGIGALGLGGYAAYKAYQGSKKKKKPASE